MLKYRLLTALVLIPIVLWIVFSFPSQWVAGLLSVFIVLGAWEWAKLCQWPPTFMWTSPRRYAAVIAFSLSIADGLWVFLPQVGMLILGIASVGWCIAWYGVTRYQISGNEILFSSSWEALIGGVILIPAWLALLMLHTYGGGELLAFLFVLIWTADSGAYFAGKHWGHFKLAYRVSPGKTWEGVWGALFLSGGVALSYALLKAMSLEKLIGFLLLSFITVVVSILGDLLESLFKRQKGQKDSGQLLPGHGGILDRIDSLTSAAPIFTLGFMLMRNMV